MKIKNKYFSNEIDADEVMKAVNEMGFDYLRMENAGMSIVTEMEKDGVRIDFEMAYDDDCVASRHTLVWNREGGKMDYFPDRYSEVDPTTDEYIQVLKRRLRKYLKKIK